MRIWLLLLLPLCGCTTFDAGPPPSPRAPVATIEPIPIVPADIRPLTADQRDMLDG